MQNNQNMKKGMFPYVMLLVIGWEIVAILEKMYRSLMLMIVN